MKFLIISNLSITILMLGIIWFVQLVHYPLFPKADLNNFKNFHSEHTKRISWIVAPLLISEGLVSTVLFVKMPSIITFIGLSILIFIWISTFFIQVPIHNKLNKEFDVKLFYKLLKSNWIRTIGWSLRSVTCFFLM